MKKFLVSSFLGLIVTTTMAQPKAFEPYRLIVHRGGMVDSTHTENGLPALQAAIARGYWMVEVDMRLIKDSVLITQHDRNLSRYFGLNRDVSELTWSEIQPLRSNRDGSRIFKLEEVFAHCRGKLQVMLDNKIPGNDTVLFGKVIQLLKQYGLAEQALMIGTDESTDFFRGKIKLSCSREQLEAYQKQPGFHPEYYYLFETPDRLTVEEVGWAQKNQIMVVGVLNKFRYRNPKTMMSEAASDAMKLQAMGVKYFQIDSEFDQFFQNKGTKP